MEIFGDVLRYTTKPVRWLRGSGTFALSKNVAGGCWREKTGLGNHNAWFERFAGEISLQHAAQSAESFTGSSCNMNRKPLILMSLVSIWLLAGGRTYAPSGGLKPPSGEIPRPPAKGRGAESAGMAYLTKPERSFGYWMARGREYLARTEYEQAILAFRKALKERPVSEEAHFLAGIAYERRGRECLPGDATNWDELAEQEYRAAIAVADYLPARYNLGMLLNRLERADEARKEFEHILTVRPRSQIGGMARLALERNVQSDFLPRLLEHRIPDGQKESWDLEDEP